MQIGLLGLGTVGTGVVELLENNKDVIAKRINDHINVKDL